MKGRHIIRNQQGFTLIEIIAVLILLGILAAVAVPKYMDLTDTARLKAAQGQISEVKARLAGAEASYLLKNNGVKPTAAQLLTEVTTARCPTTATAEGDFTFVCAANGTAAVDITVSVVQTKTLSTAQVGTYTIVP